MDRKFRNIEEGSRLRERTAKTLTGLERKAAEFGLSGPTPENLLSSHCDRLRAPSCDAGIIGEAKSGKSLLASCLNRKRRNVVTATLEDSATAHIVRLQSANTTSYRLRTKDGLAEPITADDLFRYGVQGGCAVEDIREDVAWIEVDVADSPLPKWLRLYDTQGLGAIHASHARRLMEVLPMFDAVIFVIDSDDPIGKQELDFLDFLINRLGKRHLFFVQNKIDEAGGAWEDLNKRSTELLEQRFGRILGPIHIWPVSSTQMEKYINSDFQKTAFLKDSRFEEMEAALDAFLFDVCQYYQIGSAIAAGNEYYAVVFNELTEQIGSLATSKAANERRTELTRKKAEFRRDWDTPGMKRRDLLKSMHTLIEGTKDTFKKKLSATDAIETSHFEKIDKLTTSEEIEARAKRIADELIADAMQTLNEVTVNGWNSCQEKLEEFVEHVRDMPSEKNEKRPDSPRQTHPEPEFDQWSAIKQGYWNALASGGMVGAVGIGIKTFIASAWINPVIGIVTSAASVLGFLYGVWKGGEQNIEKGKRQLKEYVGHVRQSVVNFYLHADNTADPPRHEAPASAHFDAIEADLAQRVADIAKKKLKDLEHAEEQAKEFIQFDEDQRKSKVAGLTRSRELLKVWQQELADCRQELNRLRSA